MPADTQTAKFDYLHEGMRTRITGQPVVFQLLSRMSAEETTRTVNLHGILITWSRITHSKCENTDSFKALYLRQILKKLEKQEYVHTYVCTIFANRDKDCTIT